MATAMTMTTKTRTKGMYNDEDSDDNDDEGRDGHEAVMRWERVKIMTFKLNALICILMIPKSQWRLAACAADADVEAGRAKSYRRVKR